MFGSQKNTKERKIKIKNKRKYVSHIWFHSRKYQMELNIIKISKKFIYS